MKYVSKLLGSALLTLALIQPYSAEAQPLYVHGTVDCRHLPRQQRYEVIRNNVKSIQIPDGEVISFGVTSKGVATYTISLQKPVNSEKENEIHELMQKEICPNQI